MLEYQGISGSSGPGSPPNDLSKLGILYDNSRIKFRDITDGTSKTMIVGEYSHLTRYQRFNDFQGTGDSDASWTLAILARTPLLARRLPSHRLVPFSGRPEAPLILARR